MPRRRLRTFTLWTGTPLCVLIADLGSPLCLPKTPSALLPQAGFTCFVNWDVGSYDATPQIPN